MYPQTFPKLVDWPLFRDLCPDSLAHLHRDQAQNLSYQAEPLDVLDRMGVARYLSFTSSKLRSWLGVVPAANGTLP
jgi:hypothetical protein